MAPPPGTLRVGRYLGVLALLLAVLYLLVFLPGNRHTPKLGIDLVGGREVIFKAIAPHGKPPTTSQMEEAKQIIESRVNGTGVTNATVVIQGTDQLVVDIPGGTNTDVSALGKAAVLNFRPLVAPAVQISCTTGKTGAKGASSSSPQATPNPSTSGAPTATAPATESAAPTASHSAHDAGHQRLDAPAGTAPSTTATASATKSGTAKSTAAKSTAATSGAAKSTAATSSSAPIAPPSSSAAPQPCTKNPLQQLVKAKIIPSIPNTEPAYNAIVKKNPQAATAIQAALSNYDCRATRTEPDEKNRYYVACDTTNSVAYLLGKIIVPGNQIDSASAQAPSTSGQGGISEWSVQLNLKSAGSDAWAAWTAKFNTNGSPNAPNASACGSAGQSAGGFPCSDYVAFTLDAQVISAPVTQSSINHQPTSITGGFDQASASNLAQQLNYGALPLSFNLQSNSQISATLGTEQLKAGMLAGGIGLILVVLYSLIYYRGLGFVTIFSLVVSGGLTYAMLVLLGRQIGFNLDLSGIAGFIVAIGITADSFVVFFERIKDEVHEGRSMRVAVPRAWVRARRTILSADFVSFLAAAILYYFAAGDVRGFAFTLGLSTILDLVVVFLFTHPMVSLLSRSRAFGSPRFTGLNAVRAGGIAPSSAGDEELLRKRPARPVRSTRPSRVRSEQDGKATATLDAEDLQGETGTVTTEPGGTDASETVSGETAAERAAARRARMRRQRDEGGER